MRSYTRNRWGFPDLGVGVGLRTVHYAHILETKPEVDFFEILSENYLDTGGRPAWVLDQVAERYPVVLHGVSLSIGSTDPLDRDYLSKLKALADRTKALWVSDHLCWTGVSGRNTHDLLPMPLTEEALAHVVARVKTVSDFLERPLILENASTYAEFAASSMPEWEFFARLMEEADCGMLLDVNNVYVSAFNHGFDPKAYLDAIAAARDAVPPRGPHQQGHAHHRHAQRPRDHPVWELYRRAVARTGNVPTLLEWDADIPAFDVVHAEALKARTFRDEERRPLPPSLELPLPRLQRWMQAVIVQPGTVDEAVPSEAARAELDPAQIEGVILPSKTLTPVERVGVYQGMYLLRMIEALEGDYPGRRPLPRSRGLRGARHAYVEAHPSGSYTFNRLGDSFPEFLRDANGLPPTAFWRIWRVSSAP